MSLKRGLGVFGTLLAVCGVFGCGKRDGVDQTALRAEINKVASRTDVSAGQVYQEPGLAHLPRGKGRK